MTRGCTITRATIALAMSLVFCASLHASNDGYVLQNDAMRITFAGSSSGFDCLSIINRLAENTRFVDPSEEGLGWPGLWQMTLSRPSQGPGGREQLVLSNKDAGGVKRAGRIRTKEATKLVLEWKGIALADESDCLDITAEISLGAGDGPSVWTLDVKNRSRSWGVESVSYPLLRTVCRRGTADVLLPIGALGGTLYRNNTSAYTGPYPYWGCSVQMMAFNQGDAGLYFGVQDGGGNFKTLKLTNDQHVTVEVLAENAGVAESARIPAFPVVIAAYQGDWWTAAKIYRKWALGQHWARKGWLADRADVPRSFLEIGYWLQGDAWPGAWASVETIRPKMARAREFFSPLNVALHWYNWHEIEFDSEYPQFFPPKAGVAQVIGDLRAEGMGVMPYINAQLWNTHLPSFETARAAAVKDRDGRLLDGPSITPGHTLTAMCPDTELWQKTIKDLSSRLADELNVSGIYFDQLGGTQAKPCFDPSHGHPLGGGSHWTDGYRKMLDAIAEVAAPRGVYLTSEMFAEQHIDGIHGFLTAHLYRQAEDVPLIAAVYSGYATCFGRLESERDGLDTFAMLQGDSFLWGTQPGWLKAWLLDPEHGPEADLARELALYRMAWKEFLIYGELMGEVRMEPSMDRIPAIVFLPFMELSSYRTEWAPVKGAIWRTRDGKYLGIVVMNLDSKPRQVKFSVDVGPWLKIDADHGYEVHRLLAGRSAPEGIMEGHEVTRDVTLDAREVLFLAVRPIGDIPGDPAIAPGPAGPSDQRDETIAQSLRFDQEMRRRGVDVTLPDDFVSGLCDSTATARVGVSNDGDSARDFRITWPGGVMEDVVVNQKESRIIEHRIDLACRDDEYARFEIGVATDDFLRVYPLFVRVLPPLELSLGGADDGLTDPSVARRHRLDPTAPESNPATPLQHSPGLHPGGHVNAIQSGRVLSLQVIVRNHSATIQEGRVNVKLPTNWKPLSGGEFSGLAPGGAVEVEIQFEVPPYHANTLETIRAEIGRHSVSKRVTVLKI